MVSFAIVTAALIPGIRNKYEIHAVGCRDLRKMGPAASEWVIDAEKAEDALLEAVKQVKAKGDDATPTEFYTQSCCNMRRLRAAGRIRPSVVEADVVDLAYLSEVAEAVEAEFEAVGE